MRTIGLLSSVVLAVLIGSCGGGTTSATTGRGAFGECFGMTGQVCTGTTTYEQCIESACNSQLQDALGINYKDGVYSGGMCATYIACVDKCKCSDAACQSACTLTADCTTSLTAVTSCESTATTCTLPVCTGSAGDAGALADAGPAVDVGPPADAFVGPDAGPPADAGPLADVRLIPTPDVSFFADAGAHADVRTTIGPDGPPASPISCAELAICCPNLPAQSQASCQQTVDNNDMQACQDLLNSAGAACPSQ